MTKRGALQKLWGPTPKELNVHITDCCCLCCYSYNAVVSGDFRNLIRLITGSSTILAPSTYSTFLDADFERFCLLTERKLKDGFKAAYFFPFLNVLHDNCTAGSGKKGLVGSSVRLINKRWELTIIPLLVAVHNGSQSSAKVKALITSRVEALYRVDIESMAQFTMSDTTPSALKVPKLFEGSRPTDCSMHVLNLCLMHGMHEGELRDGSRSGP
ncbi:hypothetical protein PC129_g14442 [Phytophthora cactorum]|uniref:Uncharacterized protein n=1 Tax=Phytophthora cactorum TaxID=29920 RepID=A0A8T1HQD8_9STRA|nr:hypothetical protein PC114_g17674 [Phytophthora cactorum]KAG3214650.1 hypothetical protein PC129_g14442 [Phytophthora cactorum]